MKKILIFCFTIIISLTMFTGISHAQVVMQLGLEFTGNFVLGSEDFIYGPIVDFSAYPISFEKEGTEFSVGFGLSSGTLFGFENSENIPYDVLIPVQGNLHLDTHLDEEIITNFFFSAQFKIGLVIGISSQTETHTGLILSGGAGIKFFVNQVFGFNLLFEYGLLTLDGALYSSFNFNIGMRFRF